MKKTKRAVKKEKVFVMKRKPNPLLSELPCRSSYSLEMAISDLGRRCVDLQSYVNKLEEMIKIQEKRKEILINAFLEIAEKYKTLSNYDSVENLSKLWDAPPDVSSAFDSVEECSRKKKLQEIKNFAKTSQTPDGTIRYQGRPWKDDLAEVNFDNDGVI